MKGKKFLCGLTCAAVLAVPTAALADSTDVNLIVNSARVTGNAQMGQVYISSAGHTMVPLRMVNDVMGYETEWNKDGTIHIVEKDGDVDVTLKVGSLDYVAGGQAGKFATAPMIKNNRTYLPARDFSELYGAIHWDNDTRTVWISECDDTDYQVIGTKLFRADASGIHEMALPEGHKIYNDMRTDPIVLERTINDVNYLAIRDKNDWVGKVPLYRDNGMGLEYLTDVYGSASFFVDGDTVYYTDGNMAGGWGYKPDPNRLTVTTVGPNGTTKEVKVDFDISVCKLDVEDEKLIAEAPNGDEYVLNDYLK